ncbi:MAG TPA: tyrosine-protein phosphatase [Polyangiaceae bacterium]|nr:tyrosine-protein phosphatase [Polyangiaceae bacterium]
MIRPGYHSPAGTGGVESSGGTDGTGGGVDGTGGCRPGQPILTGAVVNARDLGGTRLDGGGMVACGQLYRGAPLYNFTTAACADFAALGIRTVIDLRTEDERLQKPDAACVGAAANVVLTPLPIPYNVSRQDYIADLDAKASIAAALRVLGDPASYPVYFHCTWGRDRTGVLSAVILLALGASHADILQEYLLSEPNVGAYPDSLVGTLDEIERRGGVEAYLTASGVPMEDVEALRAQAIAP